jgi:AcrR family transcriptional regulator
MRSTGHTQDATARAIVQAALDSMEKYGMEGLTVRKIAAEANVNVAAINYHFRSKENLLAQVLDLASANAFRSIDEEVPALTGKDVESQLQEFLTNFSRGLVEYPNVSRVLIHKLMFDDQPGDPVTRRLKEFLQALAERFARLRDTDRDNPEVRLDTAKLISVLICMGLMPTVFQDALGLDVRDPDTRAELIESSMSPKA